MSAQFAPIGCVGGVIEWCAWQKNNKPILRINASIALAKGGVTRLDEIDCAQPSSSKPGARVEPRRPGYAHRPFVAVPVTKRHMNGREYLTVTICLPRLNASRNARRCAQDFQVVRLAFTADHSAVASPFIVPLMRAPVTRPA